MDGAFVKSTWTDLTNVSGNFAGISCDLEEDSEWRISLRG